MKKLYSKEHYGTMPHYIFEWGQLDDCVLALCSLRALCRLGFGLSSIDYFNKAIKTQSKKGLNRLLQRCGMPDYKVSLANMGKHGKTLQLHRYDSQGRMVHDIALFSESQLLKDYMEKVLK